MPVLKRKVTENFTVVPNWILKDQSLNLRAVGLLCWMLSKPDDWAFTLKNIDLERARDGRDAIHSAVKELVAAGYLTISREPAKNGRFGSSIWTVYDTPHHVRESRIRKIRTVTKD